MSSLAVVPVAARSIIYLGMDVHNHPAGIGDDFSSPHQAAIQNDLTGGLTALSQE